MSSSSSNRACDSLCSPFFLSVNNNNAPPLPLLIWFGSPLFLVKMVLFSISRTFSFFFYKGDIPPLCLALFIGSASFLRANLSLPPRFTDNRSRLVRTVC